MSLSPISDIGIALKADIDDYQKSMATVSDTTRGISGLFKNLATTVRNTGLIMTASSAIAGAGMLTLSRRAERVNAAFREVQSISSDSIDVQEEYGDLVRDLNTEFGLQANRLDVISGLYQSVSAGVDQGEQAQREFLETSADLATVGLVDLETSVDVLSTTMNTYGGDTEFAEEAASTLFQTVQFGKVRLEELAPVMGRIAALGSEMDVSIQELGTSMAVLTRNGFEARIAATGLRSVMQTLNRPSEALEELLRDIAFEQDGLVESMTAGSESLEGMASDYRNLTESIREYNDIQQEQRELQEDTSLSIQRARLAIRAIEEDRIDGIDDEIAAEMARTNTVEELEEAIDDYSFTLNQARIIEEESRVEQSRAEDQVQDLLDSFREQIDVAGDLEGGIGSLVVEEEGLIDTLVGLREAADENNIAFSEIFPETRALQGALALVGEDGQELTEIFEEMTGGTFDAEQAWEDLDEQTRETFDSFEEFVEVSEDLQDFDLGENAEDMRGDSEAMQDAMSQIGQAAEDLGEIFRTDTFDAISRFGNMIERGVQNLNEMDEEVRQNISQFMVLAVTAGLLIGPLLLLGGQFALIASAGSALLPFIFTIIGGFAIFASVLNDVVSGGDSAENIFTILENVVSSTLGEILWIFDRFTDVVLPALIILGTSVRNVFSDLSDEFSNIIGPGSEFRSLIERIFLQLMVFSILLSEFIDENSEEFVDFIVTAADYIENNFIPAIMAAIPMIIGIATVVWNDLIPSLLTLAEGIFVIVDAFIQFLQRDEVISFVNFLVSSLITLISVASTVISIVGSFIAENEQLVISIMGAVAIFATIVGLVSGKIAVMATLASTIAIVVKALAGLVFIFSPVGLALVALIGIFTLLIYTTIEFWDEIVAAFTWGTGKVIEILSVIFDLILFWPRVLKAFFEDGLEGVFDLIADTLGSVVGIFSSSGENMIEALANGMMDKIPSVSEAMSDIMDEAAAFLPSSPSEKGIFSKQSPEEYGENITSGTADGMDPSEIEEKMDDFTSGMPDIEYEMEFDGDGDYDVDSEIDVSDPENRTTESLPSEKPDITIEEGAIMVGPFEGISDEELPMKVRDEVDDSLDEIINVLEAKGVEVQ